MGNNFETNGKAHVGGKKVYLGELEFPFLRILANLGILNIFSRGEKTWVITI